MINNIRAITIIEGPEEVFNSKEVNKPIVTDKKPINIATNTICFGLLVIFLDAAAGIISCLLYTSDAADE